MKKVVFNKEGITDDEIDMIEDRVKILLCNSKNELLLCQDNGVLHFVGGHPEEGENIEKCASREIKEETGIHGMISLIPFLQLQEYQTNYFGTGKNGLARITYIEGKTDEVFNYDGRELDEEEAKRDFRLIYIPIANAESALEENRECAKAKGKEFIIDEMIYVLREYQKQREKQLKKKDFDDIDR